MPQEETARVTAGPSVAVILGFDYTGVATARCLVSAGVEVYGVSLEKRDIGRWSRCCKLVKMPNNSEQDLVASLMAFLGGFSNKPVIIPTSDGLALLLAKNRDKLSMRAHFSLCDQSQLQEIIFKAGLARLAAKAGVSAPAQLTPDSHEQITHWAEQNDPPYLLKPLYQNIENCSLGVKNLQLETASELLSQTRTSGIAQLVVQQLRQGGDGNIYDCYGVSDKLGRPITMAAHKRIRQHKRDFGATCYGEIPLSGSSQFERRLFDETEKLLAVSSYHGIFGIEWLHDIETDELLLVDFNARPFSSIGHLYDCGMNLPWLNYLELCGQELSAADRAPRLQHLSWIHFSRDLKTLPGRLADRSLTPVAWLRSVFQARSYALWSWKDPLPAVVEGARLLSDALRHTWKALSGLFGYKRAPE